MAFGTDFGRIFNIFGADFGNLSKFVVQNNRSSLFWGEHKNRLQMDCTHLEAVLFRVISALIYRNNQFDGLNRICPFNYNRVDARLKLVGNSKGCFGLTFVHLNTHCIVNADG